VQLTVVTVWRDHCPEGEAGGVSFEDDRLCLIELAENRRSSEGVPETYECFLCPLIPSKLLRQVFLLQQPSERSCQLAEVSDKP
jgi:hypothetical protein